DGAATALNRLRHAAYEWGTPGQVDEGFIERFAEQINDDLNMPRALAVMWDLVRSELPPATKKATLLEYDRVLGLSLADWKPVEDVIPENVLALAQQRQEARTAKRWADADALRKQVGELGYEIED